VAEMVDEREEMGVEEEDASSMVSSAMLIFWVKY
jgi:hypothetical protein